MKKYKNLSDSDLAKNIKLAHEELRLLLQEATCRRFRVTSRYYGNSSHTELNNSGFMEKLGVDPSVTKTMEI